MARWFLAAAAIIWAVLCVACASSSSPAPKFELSAADVAAELEAVGIKVSPKLIQNALPSFNAAVAKRLELEDAVARVPKDLAQSLDRDPRKDGESIKRVLESLTSMGRASACMLATDKRWKILVSRTAPKGWELPGFDDRQWKPAVDQGEFGVSPWSITQGWAVPPVAHWIWHYVSNYGSDTDTVYFRRSFIARDSETTLYITADNEFWAFLDGQAVGHGTQWETVLAIPLKLSSGKTHVFAVKVHNAGGPGALIAEAR
jgi:hypothetical protein